MRKSNSDNREGRVNGHMMTNQKNKGAKCQKTLTNETLGVGVKGLYKCYD